jgi:hypothetical protein
MRERNYLETGAGGVAVAGNGGDPAPGAGAGCLGAGLTGM